MTSLKISASYGLIFSDLNLQLDGQPPINFNSVVIDNVAMLPSIENLPGFEARAAFICKGKALRVNPVNSASVFREDVDIVPTVVEDTLSYIPWGGDNQMPFDLLSLV